MKYKLTFLDSDTQNSILVVSKDTDLITDISTMLSSGFHLTSIEVDD